MIRADKDGCGVGMCLRQQVFDQQPQRETRGRRMVGTNCRLEPLKQRLQPLSGHSANTRVKKWSHWAAPVPADASTCASKSMPGTVYLHSRGRALHKAPSVLCYNKGVLRDWWTQVDILKCVAVPLCGGRAGAEERNRPSLFLLHEQQLRLPIHHAFPEALYHQAKGGRSPWTHHACTRCRSRLVKVRCVCMWASALWGSVTLWPPIGPPILTSDPWHQHNKIFPLQTTFAHWIFFFLPFS